MNMESIKLRGDENVVNTIFKIKSSIYGGLPKGYATVDLENLENGQVIIKDSGITQEERVSMARTITRAVHIHSDYDIEFIGDIEYYDLKEINVLRFMLY